MKTMLQIELNDATLVKKLPGFTSGYAMVNGIQLRPETWWSYREMMPLLTKKYKVIAVGYPRYGRFG